MRLINLYKYGLASVGFLLDLFFVPEDGGDIFHRNFWLSQNYMELQPGRLLFFISVCLNATNMQLKLGFESRIQIQVPRF
jgi:hypothetical protein